MRRRRVCFAFRLARPGGRASVLFFRLFFNDQTAARPEIVVWDESGSQLLRSGPLGAGIDLESFGIGHDSNARHYHDRCGSAGRRQQCARGLFGMDEQQRDGPRVGRRLTRCRSQPFAATLPLHAPSRRTRKNWVLSPPRLSADLIRIGSTSSQATTFEFGLESQPLLALITFEIAGPRIDSPPEVIANGENVGPASLVMPGLADPVIVGKCTPLSAKCNSNTPGGFAHRRSFR